MGTQVLGSLLGEMAVSSRGVSETAWVSPSVMIASRKDSTFRLALFQSVETEASSACTLSSSGLSARGVSVPADNRIDSLLGSIPVQSGWFQSGIVLEKLVLIDLRVSWDRGNEAMERDAESLMGPEFSFSWVVLAGIVGNGIACLCAVRSGLSGLARFIQSSIDKSWNCSLTEELSFRFLHLPGA